MAWIELYTETNTGDADYRAIGADERVFRVWDAPQSQVLTAPQTVLDANGVPLPAFNSPNPQRPTLKLDRYMIASIAPPSFIAVALYSNDRRYSAPSITDPTEEGYDAVEGGTVYHDHEIPYAPREYTLVANPGQPPVSELRYAPHTQHTKSRGIRLGRSVSFNGFGWPQVAAIDAQKGKIHVFYNLPWLFEGGNFMRVGPTVYTIDYSWVSDDGIRLPLFPLVNPNLPTHIAQPSGFRMPLPMFPTTYVRPPFHSVAMFWNTTPNANGPPTFDVATEYDWTEPDGWRTLPGLT